jgi:hypothetical protein
MLIELVEWFGDPSENVVVSVQAPKTTIGLPPTLHPGDLDGDGDVDIFDYNIVIGNFGGSGAGDVDGDGDIDIFDYNIVIGNFGTGQ